MTSHEVKKPLQSVTCRDAKQKRLGNVRERKKEENLVLELKHFFIIFFFGELGFSEFKDPSAS